MAMLFNKLTGELDYFPIVGISSMMLFLSLMGKYGVFGQEIYGASVHWRPYDNNGKAIVLSYRLIWEKSPDICKKSASNQILFDACLSRLLSGSQSIADVSHKPLANYYWACTDGCHSQSTVSNMSQLYYTDIDTFYEVSYETGIEMRTFVFDVQDDTANIRLSLKTPNGTSVVGLGEAHLSMAKRNDTNRPNISPLLNVFPVYRVPLGCNIDIDLFPFDGDGDYVKCHWEHFPRVTDLESGAELYEDICQMKFLADSNRYKVGDQLHVSLYAHDYSETPVKFSGVSNGVSSGPFSRTPLKFLVHIGNATQCLTGPTFTKDGTLKPYFKRSYTLPFQNALLPFKLPNENEQMLTTGPRFMIFKEKKNITKIDEGVWANITDIAMKGIHQACGLAYSKDGVPGDSRCAVLMVEEPDECLSNPCQAHPGGICDNLFEYFTCTYPKDPVYNGHMWFQCQNETLYEKGDDDTALKIGLPVGLSLLFLIIVVGITCYMKRYWTEKLKKSAVDPEGSVSVANGLVKSVQ